MLLNTAALALVAFLMLPTTSQCHHHNLGTITWHCRSDPSTGLRTPGHLLGKNICDVHPEWLSLNAGETLASCVISTGWKNKREVVAREILLKCRWQDQCYFREVSQQRWLECGKCLGFFFFNAIFVIFQMVWTWGLDSSCCTFNFIK